MSEREINRKLEELKSLAEQGKIDIADDLTRLTAKIKGDGSGAVFDAWRRVDLARHPNRPNCLSYVEMISDRFVELHGDRGFRDDPALVGGIAVIDRIPFTFIGHQKGSNMKENIKRNYGMAHPEGYRKALRLAEQAAKFKRPVFTLIDTPGAYPGVTSEERGISEAIARNLKVFSRVKTQVICVVIGEGGSGGALGIGVGDRVYMLENAIYSVISPEGLASILFRDNRKAQYAASVMKLTADDLLKLGVIDGIIPEAPGGAHEGPDTTAANIRGRILGAYNELRRKRLPRLLQERSDKLFSIGRFSEPKKGRRRR